MMSTLVKGGNERMLILFSGEISIPWLPKEDTHTHTHTHTHTSPPSLFFSKYLWITCSLPHFRNNSNPKIILSTITVLFSINRSNTVLVDKHMPWLQLRPGAPYLSMSRLSCLQTPATHSPADVAVDSGLSCIEPCTPEGGGMHCFTCAS